MNKLVLIRAICLACCMTLIVCCSKDSNNTQNSLLFGKWFLEEATPQNNNLTLNENGTYIRFFSNTKDEGESVFRITGTYTLPGNGIIFNPETCEKITRDVCTIEEIEVISSEINELTDSTLIYTIVWENLTGQQTTTVSKYER